MGNAAQRKLLDELGIPAEDAPVDQFTPVGRMLYMAPADGKWSEHESKSLSFTSSCFPCIQILFMRRGELNWSIEY